MISLKEALNLRPETEFLLREKEYLSPARDVLQLVHNGSRSAYGCEFVALAQGTGAKLFTGDRKILREFPDAAFRFSRKKV